ncbi:MerR family transcriptional regulator [Tabrizicola sp.]|uniref:MerR family transcriptional regulator n=1 Tax=Tabrizicola sp. TaxID=2005166 RepID=UPI003F2B7EEE
MDKSPDAFRTISEVAEHLDTPAHVLRFWESRFPQIRPVKRAGGRRYYRPSDVALLTGIKRLLHEEGLTIRGVQKILRDHGVRHVAGLTDDSVSVDDLVTPAVVEETPAEAEAEAAEDFEADVPEAAFVAVEETEPEPVEAPRPRKAGSAQSELPLFDEPPALARAEPAAKPEPAAPRKPTLRDDVTFASMIRALQPGSLKTSQPELAALARRLAALRAQLADRAEGGNR